jgi:putative transposase
MSVPVSVRRLRKYRIVFSSDVRSPRDSPKKRNQLRPSLIMNSKWVYRLYREDGLSFRPKRTRRHLSAAQLERQPAALAPVVVDAYTREALAIDVDQGIKWEQVVETMDRIASIRGTPRTIRVDSSPEFISKALDR